MIRIVVILTFYSAFCFGFYSSKDYLERVAEGSGNVDPSGNFSIEGKKTSFHSYRLLFVWFGTRCSKMRSRIINIDKIRTGV